MAQASFGFVLVGFSLAGCLGARIRYEGGKDISDENVSLNHASNVSWGGMSMLLNTFKTFPAGDVMEEGIKRLFAPDGVWVHTGYETAKGYEQLTALYKKLIQAGMKDIKDWSPTIVDHQYVQLHHQFVPVAMSVILTRDEGEGRLRDSIFHEREGVKVWMTTNASPKDPQAPDQTKGNRIRANSAHDQLEEEAVKTAVDVYFKGFVALKPEAMQSAYGENPFFMCDFNPQREVPYGCYMSKDCGTAPYFNSLEGLLPAFKGFCSGYINLNHKFQTLDIYGGLAVATTVSFGCEGDFVTPKGSEPMPNREMFVLINKDGTWKIHSYMFTHDPKSPIQPPVSTCPP